MSRDITTILPTSFLGSKSTQTWSKKMKLERLVRGPDRHQFNEKLITMVVTKLTALPLIVVGLYRHRFTAS